MNKFIYLFKYRLVRALTVVFATLLAVVVVAGNVADAYASTINHKLGIDTFRVENNEDTNEDTIYFKSDYAENTLDAEGNMIYSEDGVKRLVSDAEAACVEIESEGIVLLKNNDALPLASGAKLSLFGQGSAVFNYGSSGSSAVSTSGYADLKTALESEGFSVNNELWNFYTTGAGKDYGRNQTKINEAPWGSVRSAGNASFSAFGDAAIVVFSRNSGEGMDVPADGTDGANGNYLALSDNERDMLKGVTELKKNGTFGKIIVILNAANQIQLDFMTDNEISVDACLWVGNVGKTGIYAVARVLSGAVVPSGRLSDTYVTDNFSSPAMASWILNANKRFSGRYDNYGSYSLNGTQYNYGVYVEGIYVGYRYYETRYEDVVLGTANVGDFDYDSVVAYPFGYGLSYTSFEYSALSVKENALSFEVSVTVTNTGDYEGKEVVQIYLQKPYDSATGVEVASAELVGYAKTSVLKKSGKETVKINVSKEQLTSYDVNAHNGEGGYVLGKGNYFFAVGKNVHDALNNILSAKKAEGVTVNDGKMTATGDKALTFRYTLSSRDENAFANSKETGNRVSNQLDFADINRYENRGDNEVRYLTRSDWTGSWPTQAIKLTLNDAMAEDLAIHKELPLETEEEMPYYGQDNGFSLVMLRSTDEVVIDYENGMWDKLLDQMTFEQQSLLLANAAFGTVALGAPINKPATKDNDGPTGVVGSKTGISFPCEGIWASSFNDELIEKVGKLLAEDALYNGFVSLYATGMNIHRTPYGGRAHEYFSEDPYLTGSAVSAEVGGIQSKGVIPTLKHYAFNDEEDQRGGIGIWLNEQEAREIMLKPFEMAMRPSMGNVHGIMTSFNRAGCIWTSASPELMINISRKEWGFDGYSITDMAESFKYYMTYDDGIMNGTDLYLAAGDELSLADYAYSLPFRLRMREACHRVLYSICNYSAAMNGLSASSKIVTLTPWWKSALNAVTWSIAAITLALVGLWTAYYVCLFLTEKNKKRE